MHQLSTVGFDKLSQRNHNTASLALAELALAELVEANAPHFSFLKPSSR